MEEKYNDLKQKFDELLEAFNAEVEFRNKKYNELALKMNETIDLTVKYYTSYNDQFQTLINELKKHTNKVLIALEMTELNSKEIKNEIKQLHIKMTELENKINVLE